MNSVSLIRNMGIAGIAAYFLYKFSLALPTAANGKSLLWEITGKSLKQPSYLFGTMHLMCAENAVLSRNVTRCLKRVSTVYLEVAMGDSGELLGGAVDFRINEEVQLSQYLPAEDYDLVRSFFEIHQPHIPFSILERQHPLMLTGSLYESFLPCEHKSGTEIKIVEQAYALNKPVHGLETLDFQKQVFHNIPYKQQAIELVKTIQTIDHFKQSMNEMLHAYKQQDIDALHDLTIQDETGVGSHLDMLLYDRNEDWVNKIEGIASTEPSLFAFGAGHLGGDKGLIRLLLNKGFMLRPIQN